MSYTSCSDSYDYLGKPYHFPVQGIACLHYIVDLALLLFFLDRELAEFVLRLPARYKLHGLRRKYLLKKAFADLLPQKILHRNKRGFQIPVSKWLRGRLRPLMEDLLSKDSLSGHGFFNPEEVRRLMDAHLSGQHDLRTPLWTLMVFQLW